MPRMTGNRFFAEAMRGYGVAVQYDDGKIMTSRVTPTQAKTGAGRRWRSALPRGRRVCSW